MFGSEFEDTSDPRFSTMYFESFGAMSDDYYNDRDTRSYGSGNLGKGTESGSTDISLTLRNSTRDGHVKVSSKAGPSTPRT
jgi:hypothetical protein